MSRYVVGLLNKKTNNTIKMVDEDYDMDYELFYGMHFNKEGKVVGGVVDTVSEAYPYDEHNLSEAKKVAKEWNNENYAAWILDIDTGYIINV